MTASPPCPNCQALAGRVIAIADAAAPVLAAIPGLSAGVADLRQATAVARDVLARSGGAQ